MSIFRDEETDSGTWSALPKATQLIQQVQEANPALPNTRVHSAQFHPTRLLLLIQAWSHVPRGTGTQQASGVGTSTYAVCSYTVLPPSVPS